MIAEPGQTSFTSRKWPGQEFAIYWTEEVTSHYLNYCLTLNFGEFSMPTEMRVSAILKPLKWIDLNDCGVE